MTLVFHHAPMSSAVTTHWVLEELGVPYDKVKLDLAAGDTRKPAHLAINPNGKVPVIVHDDVPIFESAAISIDLGGTFGVAKRSSRPRCATTQELAGPSSLDTEDDGELRKAGAPPCGDRHSGCTGSLPNDRRLEGDALPHLPCGNAHAASVPRHASPDAHGAPRGRRGHARLQSQR
jgi:hypothetical protein